MTNYNHGELKLEGKKIKDATQKMVLEITKADVRLGNTKEPSACAAARSLMRQPNVEEARVHVGTTYVKMGGKWLRYRTSDALRQEIIAFDRGGKFEPGEYTLIPLSKRERSKRGKANTPGAPSHGRPGHHRIKPHVVTGVRSRPVIE